ncbi:meckelin-like [Rhineura floridana]|uniref:meckelin-like n=1 Tax=Rhineura floridana TaxID=261503 RepID=UPI002AC88171|nr:meckelin-like [Rhineura floridana]
MALLSASLLLWLCLLYLPRCSTPQIIGDMPASSGPPGKCGAEKFLNIETGQCALCAQKQVKSPDGLGCICIAGLNGTNERLHPLDCRSCSNLPPSTLWESMFLDASFLACNNTCNVTACQILTNMVILEAFFLQNRAYDLYRKTKSQELPKLWYGSLGGISPRMVFGKTSKIDLKVIKYNVHGKFLGWEDVRRATLQLCPNRQSVLDAAFLFGTSYNESCTLDVSVLLQSVPEPIFYEMFLQFEDEEGNTRLWQVPIENPAILTNNQASLSQKLQRFFLVDGLSGRRENLSNAPATVTLAAELLLSVHLPTGTPGDNPPFLLTVKYAKRSSAEVAQVSFSVSYIQDPGTAQQATDIAFGALGFLAVLYALLETSTWARRSRLPNINFMIIVKFFAYFSGSLANVFFMVSLGIGIYWLIVFKGQQFSAVEVMLPAGGSRIETNFIIYLLCALALKTLDLIHILITQLTVSIFLIDWEKPKDKQVFKASMGDQRATSSVSAWRTFLIANEWNEIQTHRKVNASLQLFAVLLLLEVVGLKNLTSRDLNVNLHLGPNVYHAPWSPILRFGIAASVWLAVGIVQVVFSVGLYERFVEDKIHQFIDLCSLSNVSVFILTHRCYGFYIHGRSVHGHADVGMDTMHSYLRKEEENLCALRGLEAYSDVQTFEVLLTDRTQEFYDRITLSLMEFPRGTHVQSDLHKQRLRSYYALNRFLISFLEHRYRDMDYVVKDKFFLERILNMEFQEPGDISVLYNDGSALFGRTLFYNHELVLLLFETLIFSAVDLAAQDFVLATIITFVVQKLLQMLRNTLGRRNLAEKTLVEKQFLI